MWDDEINKKIKDAADQYHPAYDETAWDKMELLLNEHLPIENKRRRKYFLLLVTALLLGSSFFIIYYKQTNSTAKNLQKTEIKNNLAPTQLSQQKSLSTDKAVPSSSSAINVKPITGLNSTSPLATKSFNSQLRNINDNQFKDRINKQAIDQTNSAFVSTKGRTNTKIITGTTDEYGYTSKENTFSETEPTILNNPDLKKEIPKIKNIEGGRIMGKFTDPVESTKNKKFRNNFAINFSAGPDISSVGLNKTGRIAINYGAGISYALSNRFTLRTGFYVAEKIYSANRDDYQVPQGGASNINYLDNIDANCKVYEIPVTVSYNFGKAKHHQWFASAGLSSYLMKRESYDYYYKYPNGSQVTKSWSISNQNQNYFSVVDLSAGYQYSFSKRVSLLAEPYLKMPLSGVGAGKVKLNSGGMLFTFILKPFYKK
jgi:hypothetical protein